MPCWRSTPSRSASAFCNSAPKPESASQQLPARYYGAWPSKLDRMDPNLIESHRTERRQKMQSKDRFLVGPLRRLVVGRHITFMNSVANAAKVGTSLVGEAAESIDVGSCRSYSSAPALDEVGEGFRTRSTQPSDL
jgi:hypothetical protein